MNQALTTITLTASLLLLVQGCGRGADSLGHNGVCDAYPAPTTSAYALPFATGYQAEVSQGNCSAFTHNGDGRYAYDFAVPIGTAIHASRAGTVIEVEESFSDGSPCPDNNLVKIEHTDGTVALYLHLTNNGAVVDVGDSVLQGQQIGISGNTGCSTSAHLHFAVNRSKDDHRSVAVTFSDSSAQGDTRGLREATTYTAD